MNAEYAYLPEADRQTIDRLVHLCMQERKIVTEDVEGREFYAYPHSEGIAWGINSCGNGCNLARGVRQ